MQYIISNTMTGKARDTLATKGTLIEVPPRIFQCLQWVGRAVSNDETRYFMNVIRVEAKRKRALFVATDGRRMHIWETDKFEPFTTTQSHYVKKVTLTYIAIDETENNFQFPNWRRIIPDTTQLEKIFTTTFTSYSGTKFHGASKALVAYAQHHNGRVFNIEYVNDLIIKDFNNRWSMIVEKDKTAGGAILFRSNLRELGKMTMLVMPLQE